RDTFAGYNTLAIALSIPVSFIRGPSNIFGAFIETQRQTPLQYNTRTGENRGVGRWTNVDRMGIPAVNVVLVPFNSKDAHNAGSPIDDANRKFWPGILDTLQNLFKTDATSIAVFEDLLVKRGDYLRVDLTVPNNGTNLEARFPNGRRLTDDVVDILNFLINNRQPLPDNVNGNDVPFRNSFPFLAPSQQPARRARSTTARATKRTREFESNMHAKQATPPGAAAQLFSSLSLLRTAVTGCVLALLATSFASCHRAPPRSTA